MTVYNFSRKIYLKVLSFFLVTLLLGSCVSKKDVLYFQDLEVLPQIDTDVAKETILRSNDLLAIMVSAYDLNAVRPFNLSSISPDQLANGGGGQQKGQEYLIDSNGTIEFPVLGTVKAAGLTRGAFAESLTAKIAAYVKNPIVNVRISNYKITILGEVNKPGTYFIEDERISILEALGLAGDMTIFGQRDDIVVIRERDGKKNYARLDIRKTDTFRSDYYYLQQNDVVIIAPNKARVKRAGANPNTTVYLAIASLLVGIATLFRSEIIK